MESDEPTPPLSWLTPLHLFLGMGVVSLTVVIISTCAMYSTSGPLPPPRPPPPRAEVAAVTSYRFKEGYYRSLVEEDAKKVGLKKEDTRGLWRGNVHFSEFTGNQKLKVGGTLETTHLRLQAVSEKIWVGDEGQGYRTEHLVLKITNRTDRYLAYRVLTEVGGKCSSKGSSPHNAIALKPHEELQRAECLLNGSGPLVVKRVEILELSPLGYFYVSQLDPAGLRYERRTADGHQPPAGLRPCTILPWRAIEAALAGGDIQWYDVIDFYSRHSCAEYTYFVGYRWARTPPALPVKPPGGS
jgi:hypothetical protein